jgi:hypothetical protein
MPTEQQVTCINKSDRTDAHERIISIGGVDANNNKWKQRQAEAIQNIENNKYSFYVISGGIKTKVIVAKSALGHKYLKTEADNTTSNNLLSLPECN